MKLPTFPNPLKLFNPAFVGAPQGAIGSSGGTMMLASSGSGSGSGGGGGYDDDDFAYDDDSDTPQEEPSGNRPQSNRTRRSSAGRANATGGRSRSASVVPEERYWTDYLRIALPVIGIILMLGLLWIWASQLLGGDETDVDTTSEDSIGLVETQMPDPNAVNTEPDAAGTPGPGEIPISGETQPEATNPPFNPTDAGDEDRANDDDVETSDDTGAIEVDRRVEITDAVNVRPSAGTSGDPLWVADPGDQGTVSSGPEEADGYVWWEVVFDDGSSGFVVEDFLEIVP